MRITELGTKLATEFKDAEYLLIDRLDYRLDEQEIIYDYYGVGVHAVLIPGVRCTYVYYKTDQMLAPTTRNILAILSRHFLGNFSGYYNDWCNDDNVYAVLGKSDVVMRHKISSLKELPMPKISGEHHLHYTALEVYSSLDV